MEGAGKCPSLATMSANYNKSYSNRDYALTFRPQMKGKEALREGKQTSTDEERAIVFGEKEKKT